ncbi:MAG: alpha/beta fold hydrolase [Pseudomonadota bacterium]
MRVFSVLVFLVLTACAPRGDLLVAPDVNPASQEVEVFIATSRRLLVDRDPGQYRSERLSFLSRKISVPPSREAGSIELPTEPIDPQTQFFATNAETYAGETAFRTDIRRALMQRGRGNRDLTIYVHGFNNTFGEGVLRIAQLTSDLQIPGVAAHYSWPSAANPLGYGYDRDSMLFARDGLERVLRIAADAGAERILLVAHSMGALLTMEALRQIAIADADWAHRNLDGVILISPDIDIEVFRSQARRIDPLPERFAIFVSERDRALRLSARLTGQTSRLGNIADADALADFDVVLLDVTAFSTGAGHFTAGSSPALIALLRRLAEVDRAFDGDRAGRTGILPGTVLTVQSATNILLSGGR